jgi:2-polyprenyl-3-methyl-5-hydroxy-6-metoxy-1,4-benzoquinol methylase
MNAIDRLLQRWRIAKVRPYLPPGAEVLDIGCADGALFRQVAGLGRCVGIDPDLRGPVRRGQATLLGGTFPEALEDDRPFDAITLLAVLEHVPAVDQPRLAADVARFLKPGGYLVVTVPAPAVDRLTAWLRRLRIIHGMSLEEHTGFDVDKTEPLFANAGLRLVKHGKFQLGLNNLFVFQKPGP